MGGNFLTVGIIGLHSNITKFLILQMKCIHKDHKIGPYFLEIHQK